MKLTGVRSLLLAGTGLAMVAATPAIAQQQQPEMAQDQQCVQRLDQIEQQIAQAELQAEQQSDVEEIIQGARTLAEQGDEQGCMSVVAELEQVVVTLEDAGRLEGEPAATTEQQAAETEMQPADTEQQAAGTEMQPADTEQQAAGTEMQPAETEQQAAETEMQPAETEQQAAETEMQPADTEQQVTETEVPIEVEGTETQPEGEVTEAEPTDPAQPEAEVTEAEPTDPAQPEAEVTEAQPTEPAAEPSPLAAMSADDLIGTNVVNEQGDSIAEIVDLVTTPDEQIHAVLSVGGFLGIGAREVAVPLEEFQLGQNDEVVLAGMTEDALQQMPEYDETQYQQTDQQAQQQQ